MRGSRQNGAKLTGARYGDAMKRQGVNDAAADRGRRVLLFLTIAYAAASLLHFAHNAVFLQAYPNLPAWLTAAGVWAAWCAITLLGALGYFVYLRRSRSAGLAILAVYAVLGFGGLDHYVVAPVSAHTLAMNATILVEVAAASVLLAYVLGRLARAKYAGPGDDRRAQRPSRRRENPSS